MGFNPGVQRRNSFQNSGRFPSNNYQYLGNARRPGGVPAFVAKDTSISSPSQTVAIGDTKGARKGGASNPYGYGGSGVGDVRGLSPGSGIPAGRSGLACEQQTVPLSHRARSVCACKRHRRRQRHRSCQCEKIVARQAIRLPKKIVAQATSLKSVPPKKLPVLPRKKSWKPR